jgi:hypothetical protein
VVPGLAELSDPDPLSDRAWPLLKGGLWRGVTTVAAPRDMMVNEDLTGTS